MDEQPKWALLLAGLEIGVVNLELIESDAWRRGRGDWQRYSRIHFAEAAKWFREQDSGR